jgi:hypothetical protein
METDHLSESILKWFLERLLVPHLLILIWKRGALCFESHFHVGIFCKPFPFGDSNVETEAVCLNPHMETAIHCFQMGTYHFAFPADAKNVGFSVGNVPALRDLMNGQNYSPHFQMGTPLMETGREI